MPKRRALRAGGRLLGALPLLHRRRLEALAAARGAAGAGGQRPGAAAGRGPKAQLPQALPASVAPLLTQNIKLNICIYNIISNYIYIHILYIHNILEIDDVI